MTRFRLMLFLVAAFDLHAVDAPKTLPVRAFCIPSPSPNRLDEFIEFIEEDLAPRSVNVLILRVDYGFQFITHPEMADKGGLSRDYARKLAEACRKHQIRVVPLINLLGHQSW